MQMTGQRIRISEAVVCAELDDEAVLLNVETGLYFGLGEAEFLVWQLISDGATEEQMVASLHDTYEVGADQLREDIHDFLTTLEERGLIETTQEG